MGDRKSTWLWGCGLGCGALLIVLVVVGVGGVFFFRNTFSGFEEAVKVTEQIEQRYGRAEDYTPPESGLISSERLQAFLQVRRASDEKRREIAAFFFMIPDGEEADRLDNASFWEKAKFGLDMARGGIGLGGDMGRFFEARNNALLTAEMGLGEYQYIYCTVYYSWLGKSVEDGPASGNAQVEVGDSTFSTIRRQWVDALERAAQEANGPAEVSNALRLELEKLSEDRRRIPWQDGLPGELTRVLEPFQSDLERTYEPVTNPFELVVTVRQGRFGYTSR